MPRLKRTENIKKIVDFFHDEGRVYLRSEYIALGNEAPVPYRMFSRYFNGATYNVVIKLCKKYFPVEWAAIGSKLVEEEKPKPKKKAPAPKPVKEEKPAKEPELSPLEMLRKANKES